MTLRPLVAGVVVALAITAVTAAAWTSSRPAAPALVAFAATPTGDPSCGWRTAAAALYASLAGDPSPRATQLRALLPSSRITDPGFVPAQCYPDTTPAQPGAAQTGGSPQQGAGSTAVLPLVASTGSTTRVANTAELQQAIAAARPGDTIQLAAGSYSPLAISNVSGTAQAPITLTGPAEAVIDGGGTAGGYALHLDGASFWQLIGFSVTGGGKGVVVDGGQHNVLDSLDVGRTGDEAVHFRANSSDNSLQRSTIHDTGLAQPQYGEGVYIGSATSNWPALSGGRPDVSMRNRVVGNTFTAITAENVDVKEGTAGTQISGNRFDGSMISGQGYADSIVDIKGSGTVVRDNLTTGTSPALKNIIETHVVGDPATSGCGNRITGNTVQGFTPAGALVAVDTTCPTTAAGDPSAAGRTNAGQSQGRG